MQRDYDLFVDWVKTRSLWKRILNPVKYCSGQACTVDAYKNSVQQTWIEHDESVGTDKVEAAASGLARKHEDELLTGGIIETLKL